jgi:hypothetical protein
MWQLCLQRQYYNFQVTSQLMMDSIKSKIQSYVQQSMQAEIAKLNRFPNLEANMIELNNVQELKKVFKWELDPKLDRPDIHNFDYIEDVNERRIRDAESIATVMANVKPKAALEIGTSNGMGTLLMAVNAPEAKIYTVNIPPEEILSGEGGELTTIAIEKEKIGVAFRERGIKNVEQIYANTATWKPDIGEIQVAFVDGCHDTEFVYNDTLKILPFMSKGSFIMWHDCNLELTKKYNWIDSVCLGIEQLYRDGHIRGRMFHIRDSWVGIYQVN